MPEFGGVISFGIGNTGAYNGGFQAQGNGNPCAKDYGRKAARIFEHRGEIKQSVEKQLANYDRCVKQAFELLDKPDYSFQDLCEAIRQLQTVSIYEFELDKHMARYEQNICAEKLKEHEKTLSKTNTLSIFLRYQNDYEDKRTYVADLKSYIQKKLSQLQTEKVHFYSIKELESCSSKLDSAVKAFNASSLENKIDLLKIQELRDIIDEFDAKAKPLKDVVKIDADKQLESLKKHLSDAEVHFYSTHLFEMVNSGLNAAIDKNPCPFSQESFLKDLAAFKKAGSVLAGDELLAHERRANRFEVYQNLLFNDVTELKDLVLSQKESSHFKYFAVLYCQRLTNENRFLETFEFFNDWKAAGFNTLSAHDLLTSLRYFSNAAKELKNSSFKQELIPVINSWIDQNAKALEDPKDAKLIFQNLGYIHLALHNYDSKAIMCYIRNLEVDFSNPDWKDAVKNATYWIPKKQRLDFLEKLPHETRKEMKQSMGIHAYHSAGAVYGLAASVLRLASNIAQEKIGDHAAIQAAQILANTANSSLVKRNILCHILKQYEGHEFDVKSSKLEDYLGMVVPGALILEPIVQKIIEKASPDEKTTKKIQHIAKHTFSILKNVVFAIQDGHQISENFTNLSLFEALGPSSINTFSLISGVFNSLTSLTMIAQPKWYTPSWQAVHHITRSNTSGLILKDVASIVSNSSTAIAYFAPGFFSKSVSATCQFAESIVGRATLELVGEKCASCMKFTAGIGGALDIILGLGFLYRMYNQYPEKRALYTIVQASELVLENNESEAKKLIVDSKRARWTIHEILNDFEFCMVLMNDIKTFHLKDPSNQFDSSLNRLLAYTNKDPSFNQFSQMLKLYKMMFFVLKKDTAKVNELMQENRGDQQLLIRFERLVIESIFSRFLTPGIDHLIFDQFITDLAREINFFYFDGIFKSLTKYLILHEAASQVGAQQEIIDQTLTTISTLKAQPLVFEILPNLKNNLIIREPVLCMKGMKWDKAKRLYDEPDFPVEERSRIQEDLSIHILETMMINELLASDLSSGMAHHIVSGQDNPLYFIKSWLDKPTDFLGKDPFNLQFLKHKSDLYYGLDDMTQRLNMQKLRSVITKKIEAFLEDVDHSLSQLISSQKLESIEPLHNILSDERIEPLVRKSADYSQLSRSIHNMTLYLRVNFSKADERVMQEIQAFFESFIADKERLSPTKSLLTILYNQAIVSFGSEIINSILDTSHTQAALYFIERIDPFIPSSSVTKRSLRQLQMTLANQRR